jgi:hypothetical protein
MTNFYKELNDIDNWQELTNFVLYEIQHKYADVFNRINNLSYIELPEEFFVGLKPKIDKVFEKYNIHCKLAAVYVTYEDKHGDIHCDNRPENYRINLPVLNCQNTKTQFYSVSSFRWYRNSLYIVKLPAHGADVKLIDEFELSMPTVVSVNDWHCVKVSNQLPRISLTLSFEEDLQFLIK